MLAAALSGFFKRSLRTFYRVEVNGRDRVPVEGPLLLVANHPNSLVDPVLAASASERPARFLAKSTLFKVPVFGTLLSSIGGIPVYRKQDAASAEHMARNEETFEAAAAALQANQVLCLFPEGTSHSDPMMKRMKTGAARMALLAEERSGWSLGVKILPIGLTYEAKKRFRSRAIVQVGHPIEARFYRQAYEADPVEAAQQLTAHLAQGLSRVVLQGESWNDVRLVQIAERILTAAPEVIPLDAGKPEEEARAERQRRIADQLPLARARDPERTREISERLLQFVERLDSLGVRDDALVKRYAPGAVLRYTLRSLALLLLVFPLALVGVAAFWLPYKAHALIAAAAPIAEDRIASLKAGVGLIFIPLAYFLCIGLAGFLLGFWPALGAALVLPPCGFAAIALRDRQRQIVDELQAFFLLANRRKLRGRLIERRTELAREILSLAVTLPDPAADDQAQIA